jgi:hypothetical protein
MMRSLRWHTKLPGENGDLESLKNGLAPETVSDTFKPLSITVFCCKSGCAK